MIFKRLTIMGKKRKQKKLAKKIIEELKVRRNAMKRSIKLYESDDSDFGRDKAKKITKKLGNVNDDIVYWEKQKDLASKKEKVED